MRNLPLHSPSNGEAEAEWEEINKKQCPACSIFPSPPASPPPPAPCAPYFLKVSVWEINDPSAAKDDSLHKDDIELISEMLRDWLFDVYRQTWIIKILLKNPWMADTRILFVMINLAQSLQWESSWSVSGKIAFHSLRWISLRYLSSSSTSSSSACSTHNSWSDCTWRVSAAAHKHVESRTLLLIGVSSQNETLQQNRSCFSTVLAIFRSLFLFLWRKFLKASFLLSLGCQLVQGCVVTLAFNSREVCSKTLL